MAKHILSDGKADSFTTLLNDSMFVLKGGSANKFTLEDGGYLTLEDSGTKASGVLIKCGGWRAKAKEFHPDKVAGKGLSAAFIERAKMQMQKINNAYEAICKSRGIH